MAHLEDLIAEINDPQLRQEIASAVSALKRRQRFGIVFEQHIPETTAVPGTPLQVGSIVQRRDTLSASSLYRVTAPPTDGRVMVQSVDGGQENSLAISDLLVVKRVGDPIYPALTPIGAIRRGDPQRPHHAVINGENYHALQLLLYLFEGQVDCIYIDPPYNTGARDWKYNNRYVDDNDAWRHSKWLSFMEKRLQIARRLLKSDGVLIVTIDEHELLHLGMLLERILPEYLRYIVTIIVNPKGNYKVNFARVEENAIFCCPQLDGGVIAGFPTDYLPGPEDIFTRLDDESENSSLLDEEESDIQLESIEGSNTEIRWYNLLRSGTDSRRVDRPNMFYPVYIDEHRRVAIRTGKPLSLEGEPSFDMVDGLRPVWPINSRNEYARWAIGREDLERRIASGEVRVGRYDEKRKSWSISYFPEKDRQIGNGPRLRRIKTVWRQSSHDPGAHGSDLLTKLLGKSGLFPFPKSVYAVRDCLAAVVRNRPEALIVDFFAGSGTTFHATCLLNAEDGGRRRSIIVTNNEVAEVQARALYEQGHYRGSSEFEAHGIFERVTRPRCEAVITGRRSDGTVIAGKHLNGRAFSQGFDENVEFYQLDYLDPDEVDLGRRFSAIHPSLWLAAGGIGDRAYEASENGFCMPADSNYAVLFRDSRFGLLQKALTQRPDITNIWLVTDSEEAFAEMRSALPAGVKVSRLYEDYLRSFRTR